MADPATNPPALTQDDVRHVARLARLRLTPEEATRMTAELSAIMAYVRKLSELDTANVPPTAQVQVDRLPLRPDEPRPSLSHEAALAEAPRTAHEGFAVPGFVEE
jgi:aspartyl-tRNA(Asn)/glutamyl-tRNA(Gln) amidotransferase subunit C